MSKHAKILAIGFCVVAMNSVAWGQTTYTWLVASGVYTTDTNWNPTRTTPAVNDILVFDGTVRPTITVTDIATETIGQLVLTNIVVVSMSASTTAKNITIAGGTGTDLDIVVGSALNISGAVGCSLSVATGATGSVSGSMSLAGTTHRLLVVDANGVTFQSGSLFTAGTGFSGNAFGTTSLNSVIFANGSVYAQTAGSNPFGVTQPSSVVTFQSGSLFRSDGAITLSFSGRTYANFELNSGAAPTVTGTSAVSINNLTITSGTLNFNMTGTPGHSINGNISIASGQTLNFSPATGGTVNFNGTSAQSISGAGTLTFSSRQRVTMNNSSGLTLNRSVTLDSVLTLTSGNITTTSSNLLTLGANGASGGSSSSFVSGPMAHTIATTSSAIKTFPIGKGSAYRNIDLTITQDAITSTTYTAEVFNTAPTTRTLPGTLDKVSTVRYWNVVKGAGANVSNATIKINYDSDDGVTDASNLRIAKDDGATTWVDLAGTGTANTTGSITSVTNFTSFSDFTFGNNTGGTNPLPVQLTSFTAAANRLVAQLHWSTATETNNYGFEIERRAVGYQQTAVSWHKVGFVAGSGTSSVAHEYSYDDRNLAPGRYAYRLKQLDNDGTFEYFGNAEVEIGLAAKEFKLESNYPNPFNPATTIQFTLAEDGKASLKVFNMLGQEVATLFDGEAQAGRIQQVTFDAATLPSGMYFAKLEAGKQQMTRKMMLVK